MIAAPLVLVRKTTVYPVPPVCHARWTEEDWRKLARVVVEPLILDAIGFTWIATGERGPAGDLIYRAIGRGKL